MGNCDIHVGWMKLTKLMTMETKAMMMMMMKVMAIPLLLWILNHLPSPPDFLKNENQEEEEELRWRDLDWTTTVW